MGRPPVPNIDRFMSKVRNRPSLPKSECWLWEGSVARGGYGQFRVRLGFKKFKMWKAHRFSWVAVGKEIPRGLMVLHKCDNPPCVRPSHLFLGTGLDNIIDMLKKGRGPDFRGVKNPRFGKPVSEETRRKMSNSQSGRKHPPDTIAKMSASQFKRFEEERRGGYGKYSSREGRK